MELFPEVTHWWLSNLATFLPLRRFPSQPAEFFFVLSHLAYLWQQKRLLALMKNKWYISFLDFPQRAQIHTVMDAESLRHILVIWAVSSLLYSLSMEQKLAISGVWCRAPFHLTWCFLYSCCSIKLIHSDGRSEGPLWPAPVFPERLFASPSSSNKTNVSFHMKGGTKKSQATFGALFCPSSQMNPRMDRLKGTQWILCAASFTFP